MAWRRILVLKLLECSTGSCRIDTTQPPKETNLGREQQSGFWMHLQPLKLTESLVQLIKVDLNAEVQLFCCSQSLASDTTVLCNEINYSESLSPETLIFRRTLWNSFKTIKCIKLINTLNFHKTQSLSPKAAVLTYKLEKFHRKFWQRLKIFKILECQKKENKWKSPTTVLT